MVDCGFLTNIAFQLMSNADSVKLSSCGTGSPWSLKIDFCTSVGKRVTQNRTLPKMGVHSRPWKTQQFTQVQMNGRNPLKYPTICGWETRAMALLWAPFVHLQGSRGLLVPPRVSMTPKKWVHDPLILRNDSFFKGHGDSRLDWGHPLVLCQVRGHPCGPSRRLELHLGLPDVT